MTEVDLEIIDGTVLYFELEVICMRAPVPNDESSFGDCGAESRRRSSTERRLLSIGMLWSGFIGLSWLSAFSSIKLCLMCVNVFGHQTNENQLYLNLSERIFKYG